MLMIRGKAALGAALGALVGPAANPDGAGRRRISRYTARVQLK